MFLKSISLSVLILLTTISVPAWASPQLLFLAAVRNFASVPTAPTVTVSDSPAQLTASWTDLSSETSYEVFYSTSSSLNDTTYDGTNAYPTANATAGHVTGIAAGSTNYNLTGMLTAGVTYYVRVAGRNASGLGALSTAVSAVAASGPIFQDTFSNASLDTTKWQTLVTSPGTAVETTVLVLESIINVGGGAAAVAYKVPITKTDNVYTVRAKPLWDTTQVVISDDGEGTIVYGDRGYNIVNAFEVWDITALPTAGILGSTVASSRVLTFYVTPDGTSPAAEIVYWDQTGAMQTKNTGTVGVSGDVEYDYVLTTSASGWRAQIKSVDGLTTVEDSGLVLWSATKSIAHNMYLVIGDPYIDNNAIGYTQVSKFLVQ